MQPSAVLALAEVEGRVELIGAEDLDGGLRAACACSPATPAGRPGQLDGELEQEAWITLDAAPDDAFAEGDIWAELVQRKGGGYALMATMPTTRPQLENLKGGEIPPLQPP